VLESTRVLELLPRAILNKLFDVQLDALFYCLVRVVRADGCVVDPLLLSVTTGKIREVTKEVDDCVRFAFVVGVVGSNLWPSGWRWSLELGRIEVKVSGEEGVELGHAGDDLVAVVRHDCDHFGVLGGGSGGGGGG
jgi:hypothetical protein